MRVHVAVCDDEETQTDYLAKLVQKWSADAVITAYRSAEEFLFTYEESRQADILLLDIQMERMDGVALARELRRLDGRHGLQIIFVTGHPDFWAEGYEVNALHYLMKPVEEKKQREVRLAWRWAKKSGGWGKAILRQRGETMASACFG